MKKPIVVLIFGDFLTLAVVTIVGFATHGETGFSFIPRMATTFFPLVAGWSLIAPWLGLFKEQIIMDRRQLWRPVLGMMLAAPMTAILRAALLNTAALPLFTLILGLVSSLGLVIWRALYRWLVPK
jgi:hypothetical protein